MPTTNDVVAALFGYANTKLAQQHEAALEQQLYRSALQQLPELFATQPNEQARQAIASLLGRSLGAKPETLLQAFGQTPTSIEATRAQKTAAGAKDVPDSEVAAASLTGQNQGALGLSQKTLSTLFDPTLLTPEQQQMIGQEFYSRLLSGQGFGEALVDASVAQLPATDIARGAKIKLGVGMPEPDLERLNLQADTDRERLKLEWQTLWVQRELGLSEAQARDLTARASLLDAMARGDTSMTKDQQEAMNSARQVMEDLTKGLAKNPAERIRYAILLDHFLTAAGVPHLTDAELNNLGVRGLFSGNRGQPINRGEAGKASGASAPGVPTPSVAPDLNFPIGGGRFNYLPGGGIR